MKPNPTIIIQITLFILLSISFISSARSDSDMGFFFNSSSKKYKDVIVKQIRSTDTFILEESTGEKPMIIKLIGIRGLKAPKKNTEDIERDQFGFVVKKEVTPLTPIEEKAYEFVRELVKGQHVRLEFDIENKSEDFETLAYVFLLKDNTFVNAEIIRNGYANLQIRQPNTKYAEQLREAYREARAEKRGLQGE